MRLEYDPDSGAAYIRLRQGSVARTDEIAPGVLVDFADDGRPVGIELLDAASILGGPPRGVEFVLLGERLARAPGKKAL